MPASRPLCSRSDGRSSDCSRPANQRRAQDRRDLLDRINQHYPLQTSSQSTATPRNLDYIAVGPWFAYVIEGASICASRCRKARTSLFSVTMLQIIHIPIPPAIGNHSQAISSSHIDDLLCTSSSALLGHAGPDGFTIVPCILCINASGAASGFTGGLSGSALHVMLSLENSI